MMSLMLLMVVLILLSGFLSYCLNKTHLLVSLLSLEYLALGIFFFCLLYLITVGGDVVFILYYLVMVVSEGSLGLALVVVMSYNFGSDYMKSFSSLVC